MNSTKFIISLIFYLVMLVIAFLSVWKIKVKLWLKGIFFIIVCILFIIITINIGRPYFGGWNP